MPTLAAQGPAAQSFVAKGASHAVETLGPPLGEGVAHIIWAHGWGQDHRAFLAIARSLERRAHHTLIDFPGFGRSPRPAEDWGTTEYGDALAEWLETLPRGRRILVGHSFGCRVGLRLAANHPVAIDAMVLVAGAGLQRQRSAVEKLRLFVKVRGFKALKLLEKLGVDVSARRARHGSEDYRNAGAMRPILVKTVSEDQTEVARKVRCPVALIYGEKDTSTPPEMGERLAKLIPEATLQVLPGLDHHTVLTDGGPQVAYAVSHFLDRRP